MYYRFLLVRCLSFCSNKSLLENISRKILVPTLTATNSLEEDEGLKLLYNLSTNVKKLISS